MDRALVSQLEKKALRPNGVEGLGGSYMEVDNEALIEETIKEVCQYLTDIGQDYCRERIEKQFGL